ncbi:MAG: hypothetical protein P8J87_19675 [Verrucomicrobiales bacterium]|nr:hypothetical protein [Verrucomicrobiales bacterium]
MPANPTTNAETAPLQTDLSEVESHLIQFFVHLATSLSLPRSLGEIFGLLFASPAPVNFADIVDRLKISKGSASQGLQTLLKLNAIHTVYVAGDRRTFYAAETSVRTLFSNFINDTVRPHLASGEAQLDLISQMLEAPETAAIIRQRVDFLHNWHRKAQDLLPWISQLTAPESPQSQPKIP